MAQKRSAAIATSRGEVVNETKTLHILSVPYLYFMIKQSFVEFALCGSVWLVARYRTSCNTCTMPLCVCVCVCVCVYIRKVKRKIHS